MLLLLLRPWWERDGRSAVSRTPCLVMACDGVLIAIIIIIINLFTVGKHIRST